MRDRRRYRRTPPGAATVADLVRPGDTVLTSYSTGGVVIEVKEHFYEAPTGETLSHFTIVYVPPDRAEKYRDTDRHRLNECVAVGDHILMMFEANLDEVFVIRRAKAAATERPKTVLIKQLRRRRPRWRERGAGRSAALPGRRERAGGAATLARRTSP